MESKSASSKCLKTLQRGPTVTALISFLGATIHFGHDVKTEIFDVNGLVDISFKCRMVSASRIITYIRMKKNAKAQNAVVEIEVTAKEFNEQFFCSVEWVEAEIKPIGCNLNKILSYVDLNCREIGWYSYVIEVDITAREIMQVPSLQFHQLYEDTDFTDLQLQATDGNVAVHKTLLLAHSDVFKAMMKGEWKEKSENCISIDGATVQTLQHLKDYMYLGTLPEEGLESLLVVAARYLMDKLKMDCIKKMAHSIKPENISDLIKLACQHNIPELVGAILHRTPDDVMNDFYQLKIKDQESNDEEKI